MAVFGQALFTDKNGYKSVDYSRLTPMLVKAIKEQQKVIRLQQLAINNQEARIKKLESVLGARQIFALY